MTTSARSVQACDACELPASDCVCPDGGPAVSRVELVVVRHFVERHKISSSSRLVPLAVAGSRVIDFGGPGVAPPEADALACPGCFLLFPGGQVLTAELAPRVTRLVVPDGSWTQARRMRARVAALAALPSVSVDDPRPTPRLRRPRREGELPTAIAIARALEICGDGAAAALLTRTYEALHAVLTHPSRRR